MKFSDRGHTETINNMNYEQELNPEQYKAVTQKDGPVLILAGAGSGKTRVITYRIAYLIERYGVSPYNILAITFTNKAAREMRERVESMLGDESRGAFISTFHRFCGQILRDRAQLIGYTSSFAIYDEKDTERVIKDCFKDLEMDAKKENPGLYRALISKLKNNMTSPDEYSRMLNPHNPQDRTLLKVYRLYDQKMFENNALDFDDMLVKAVQLLKDHPDVCDFYATRYRYIMVDEYQDTNKVQYLLVRLLSPHGNLCVVGDDDQSIYSFRGADINNILSFEKDFPDCTVIKLEQNYRSTKNILDAANSVISENNGSRKEKKLWTAKNGGEKIARFIGENQLDESRFIAGEISRLVSSGKYGYEDIAILYRQNALSQYLESEFVRRALQLRVYGGMRFFERAEVKVLINYLRLFESPGDANAFTSIINIPKRSIGDKGVETIIQIANRNHITPVEVAANVKDYPELSRYAVSLKDFADCYENVASKLPDLSVPEFVELVNEEMGLRYFYEASDKEKDEDRCGNLMEFVTVAKDYVTATEQDSTLENSLAGFLQNISLTTDMDAKEEDDSDKVTLMTIHSSKGLEFPVVFVVAMEEGIFPTIRAMDEGNIDEERRLCYVAITRAKERLYLSYVKERMLYGQTKFNPKSEFLDGIPQENSKYVNYLGEEISERAATGRSYTGYVSYGDKGDYLTYGNSENQGYGYRGYGRNGYSSFGSYGKKNGGDNRSSSLFPSFDDDPFGDDQKPINKKVFTAGKPLNTTSVKLEEARLGAKAGDKDIRIGDHVAHPKFGEGLVTSIEGELTADRDDRICEISFEKFGLKRFAMQYTKLKKL